jgi:hypothetical protein
MGPGIFENDAALDVLDAAVRAPLAEIEGFVSSNRVGPEDIDAVAACVAIHAALIGDCGAARPPRELAETVRAKVLQLFDDEYDRLKPPPAFKSQRRRVLVDTLDRYRSMAAPDPGQ